MRKFCIWCNQATDTEVETPDEHRARCGTRLKARYEIAKQAITGASLTLHRVAEAKGAVALADEVMKELEKA